VICVDFRVAGEALTAKVCYLAMDIEKRRATNKLTLGIARRKMRGIKSRCTPVKGNPAVRQQIPVLSHDFNSADIPELQAPVLFYFYFYFFFKLLIVGAIRLFLIPS